MYHVNEDYYEPPDSATIHRDSCTHAQVRQKSPKTGKWHSFLPDYETAKRYAQESGRKNIRYCTKCFG